ncbi:MAG: aldehyde dehydrogenase family protein, partial [Hyphomonadaceae bacterium]
MARAEPSVSDIFASMEYGPAPEGGDRVRAWLKAHDGGFGHFINGAWTKPSKEKIESRNPANGALLGRISIAGEAEIDAAIAAAKDAFPAWSALPGHQRARALYALARLVQKHSRFLAVLETLDNGKPIRETRDIDVPLVARHFSYHAGWAQLMDAELRDHAPLGVCAQIIPWNFPLLMLAWKVAPALAAGNCVVLKPAEQTSLSALYFMEMAEEAGLPPGALNLITGAGETGAALAAHPGTAKVAFTGSTEVGRRIRAATAAQDKKLTLELGGKSPFLVFEDADLDGAVEGLVDGIFFNQGQVCCAGSRLLAEESIAPRLLEKLKTRLSHFRIGDPLDKAVDMGAIVEATQLRRIETLVAQGVAEGAQAWRPDIACPAQGCFYPPTLLTGISPANTAAVEEIFGPVLAVMTFRRRDEAIQLANNTRYGLSATIWSENINRAHNVAAALKAGTVWINMTNQFDAACGFGGYRESGFGREGGLE